MNRKNNFVYLLLLLGGLLNILAGCKWHDEEEENPPRSRRFAIGAQFERIENIF